MKTNYNTILAILVLLITLSSCDFSKQKYEKPKNLISKTEAYEMKALYINNQYKFINKGLNDNYNTSKMDFTEFSVSIEELKNYINYAEGIAKKENYKNLGIRFHLGGKMGEDKVPYTSIYYNTIGIHDSLPSPFPILYEKLSIIGSILDADKVGTSGNPPKLDLNNK